MRLSYRWQVAIISTLGLFMAVLDNTIVSVALPQMQQAFHTDLSTITWVATGYFLSQAAVIPITGYLSDRIGAKLVFLIALGLFTVGSGLCASATNETYLIIVRIIQGIGGGALFPVAFALVYRVFPPTERGAASAIIGFPVLLAPAFGPTIGGYLTTNFDWNAIFTVNLPVGVATFLLALFILRNDRADQADTTTTEQAAQGGRFDVLGLILAMVGFTAVVYGISEASTLGWGDRTVLVSLIGGCIVLVAFTITELRVKDPVLDVRLFLNYTFSIANVLIWALVAFLFGSLFLLPFFFERIQGLTPLSAGTYLIAQGLSAAIGVALSGTLYNRVGPRILVTLGFLLVTIGTFGLTQLSVSTTGLSLQGWFILRGFGLGFVNIPLQTLALSVVSNKAIARASSLINVTRQVFGAIGVAALTTYLTQQATTHAKDIAATLPKQSLTGFATACAPQLHNGAKQMQACVTQHVTQYVTQHAATQGLNDTFTIAMIGSAICIALALFVGRDRAIEAAKRAKTASETVEVSEPTLVAEM
jgi:EmrB/QacA subfamily drug resistance transporter